MLDAQRFGFFVIVSVPVKQEVVGPDEYRNTGIAADRIRVIANDPPRPPLARVISVAGKNIVEDCTAIRRVFVPPRQADNFIEALKERLRGIDALAGYSALIDKFFPD
jgi:hypothetical protein